MKKYAFWILIVFGTLTADPASAWFWEKSEVKSPPASTEVDKVKEAKEVKKEKGFWAGVLESGRAISRDIGHYFKGIGKEAKKNVKEIPGEAKKEAKVVGKSIKESTRSLGQETKKGGKAVGQGFKELGHDIKDATKSVFDGKQKESGN